VSIQGKYAHFLFFQHDEGISPHHLPFFFNAMRRGPSSSLCSFYFDVMRRGTPSSSCSLYFDTTRDYHPCRYLSILMWRGAPSSYSVFVSQIVNIIHDVEGFPPLLSFRQDEEG
jgi:hypothetical protein